MLIQTMIHFYIKFNSTCKLYLYVQKDQMNSLSTLTSLSIATQDILHITLCCCIKKNDISIFDIRSVDLMVTTSEKVHIYLGQEFGEH